MVTGKYAAYFMSLMVTSIASSVCDSNSDSDEVLKILLGLLELWWSIVFSVSDFLPVSEWV